MAGGEVAKHAVDVEVWIHQKVGPGLMDTHVGAPSESNFRILLLVDNQVIIQEPRNHPLHHRPEEENH